MASFNILSVALSFVENHRFQFPSPDPTTWLPVTDAKRGPPKNKVIYVFQSLGGAPFKLFLAYRATENGNLLETSAEHALQGKFDPGIATDSVRLPEKVAQTPARYFFLVARTAFDGSFIDELAANPRPELQIVSLTGLKQATQIGVTDPLTIVEQLTNDYDKLRRASMALIAPFTEQTDPQRLATQALLKQRLMTKILSAIQGKPQQFLSDPSNVTQSPAAFLKQEDQKVSNAETARENKALDVSLWLNGPLMGFVRSAYRAVEKPNAWIDDIGQLIKVEAHACASIADSYRGLCHVRGMIASDNFLIREFIARDDAQNDPDLAVVQATAKKSWDVISKLWIAVGGVMAALDSRKNVPRLTQPNSAIPITKIVRTYNTVFGDAILTLTAGPASSFKFRDPLSGQLHDVSVTPDFIQLSKENVLIQLQRQSAPQTNPFTAVQFRQGVAIINLGLAVSAAYEQLLGQKAASTQTKDKVFTTITLLGAIADTGSAFPGQVARLFRLTGRGVAFLGLASAVLGIATSIGDVNNALNNGDHDAAFGVALVGVGNLFALNAGALTLANGGVVVFEASLSGAIGLACIVVGTIVVVALTDTDWELFARHYFLGTKFGQDINQPGFATAPFFRWNAPEPPPNAPPGSKSGLDFQIDALFNLIFGFEISTTLVNVKAPIVQLRIDYASYFAGCTFNIKVTGPGLGSGVTLVVDPTDQRTIPRVATGVLTINPVPRNILIRGDAFGLTFDRTDASQLSWEVVMNLGQNNVQTPGADPNRGFLIATPGFMPLPPKGPAKLTGFGRVLSTT